MDPIPEDMDRVFASQVILKRCEQLLGEISALKRGIRNESIHDTRVASRRMRAALEAFRDLFPAAAWQEGFDCARAVTRTLGKAREEEVTLALLNDLTNGGDLAENLCREYLEERCRKNIARLQGKMIRQLKAMNVRRMRSQFRTLVDGLGPLNDLPETSLEIEASGWEAQARPDPTVRRAYQATLFPQDEHALPRALRVVKELSEAVLSFRARYDFPRASDERLHSLRIASKKLRYAMEIFDPVWPGGLAGETAAARTLQDNAGEYHDWVVLRIRLQAEIRRLTSKETTHLAFQIGRLMAHVEDRKSSKRKEILPALTALQAGIHDSFDRAAGKVSRPAAPEREVEKLR
jgi:CHAD domain-containing protein